MKKFSITINKIMQERKLKIKNGKLIGINLFTIEKMALTQAINDKDIGVELIMDCVRAIQEQGYYGLCPCDKIRVDWDTDCVWIIDIYNFTGLDNLLNSEHTEDYTKDFINQHYNKIVKILKGGYIASLQYNEETDEFDIVGI